MNADEHKPDSYAAFHNVRCSARIKRQSYRLPWEDFPILLLWMLSQWCNKVNRRAEGLELVKWIGQDSFHRLLLSFSIEGA
jgi:hypothetical protein